LPADSIDELRRLVDEAQELDAADEAGYIKAIAHRPIDDG
jgi:hypothetical protein